MRPESSSGWPACFTEYKHLLGGGLFQNAIRRQNDLRDSGMHVGSAESAAQRTVCSEIAPFTWQRDGIFNSRIAHGAKAGALGWAGYTRNADKENDDYEEQASHMSGLRRRYYGLC